MVVDNGCGTKAELVVILEFDAIPNDNITHFEYQEIAFANAKDQYPDCKLWLSYCKDGKHRFEFYSKLIK